MFHLRRGSRARRVDPAETASGRAAPQLRLNFGAADPLRLHVEAGVAACHAKAASYATTDWEEIVALYDALSETSPSPVVGVNRALAVAICRGAMAGLDELDAIPKRELLAGYPYALATYAELHASSDTSTRLARFSTVSSSSRRRPAERALLRRKRAALGR